MVVIPVVGLTAMAAWIVPLLVNVTASSDRLEVIRIALTVGAGTGGVVALVLAGRRQWSTEQAHKATEQAHKAAEHDAAERRTTDLYTKAVDQLGSDHAAVRLGGLYALERLADATPTQEGTIGNVICAYLRMPYTSPLDLEENATADDRREHDRLAQELETRRAALEIVVRHNNREEPKTWWFSLQIRLQRANLAGADLHDADLTHADLRSADLRDADLTDADLTHADLTNANLTNADMAGAVLVDASLTNADLTHADMDTVNLAHARLNQANLSEAYLGHADLINANLVEANLTDGTSRART